jgi:hypothetical protein
MIRVRLLEILKDVGFEAQSMAAFDSAINDICLIEMDDRTKNAVIVEGRKL